MLLVGLPVILLLMHVHWMFFLLDEVLFSSYRKVAIKRPVFIVGVPRSGTTFLQRSLSQDAQFTTTSLQECLLTPAISQRYLARGLSRLLGPAIRAFGQLLGSRSSRFSQRMQDVHPLGLDQAEEDFLLLLPALSCFIQMVVFPNHVNTWQLGFFDEQLSRWRRNALMSFYYRQVQRHLYYHGPGKVYLAKNPSFTSLIHSLRYRFADAIIVACVRQPDEALESQFRSLEPAFELLGHDISAAQFEQRITALLAHYYREIERWSQVDSAFYILEITELKSQLFSSLRNLYQRAGLSMSADLVTHYQQLSEKNKSFRSKTAQVNINQSLAPQFQHLWPLSGHSRLLSSTENVS